MLFSIIFVQFYKSNIFCLLSLKLIFKEICKIYIKRNRNRRIHGNISLIMKILKLVLKISKTKTANVKIDMMIA